MQFSVIVPLYNKEPYIEKALNSILSQSFKDYELIVVNDGSLDNSLAIAEDVLSGIMNARIISQDNSGVSTARNNAVAISSGDYLCFLDADDWWEQDYLAEMNALIKEFPDAGIYGTGYTIVNERKRKTRIAPIGVEDGFSKGYINYCKVYAKTLCMPLTSISVCIPRQIFAQTGGFNPNLKLGEDFDLWIRIALKNKVVFLNKPLSNYNQDVDVSKRGIGHLVNPQHHMLWNLSYLEEEERRNPDYKQLIDNLRTYGLEPYYLSWKYHNEAADELKKVDWNNQTQIVRRKYHRPVWLLRVTYSIKKIGSCAKQVLFKIAK